jgi:hypothetical protein
MPFEILSLIEGLAQAALLWPSNYAKKYHKQSSSVILELILTLECCTWREPFEMRKEELGRFMAAKDKLVALVSNAPMPGVPMHGALKPIMMEALDISRSLRTGSASGPQVREFVERLRKHHLEHHGN